MLHKNLEAVYYATKFYIDGKTGIVVGSLEPWAEVFCLKNGAKMLYTVEYAIISSTHPSIKYINAMSLVENYKK